MHDQHEREPDRGAQTAQLATADGADEGTMHHSIADDLHALALVVAAAIAGSLASERHAP